jgi:hypothetical protein
MEKNACQQCRGTGLVSLSTAPEPEPIAGFSAACSDCDVGNVLWDIILDLIAQVQTEMRRLDLADLEGQLQGKPNAQSRDSPRSASTQPSRSAKKRKRSPHKPSASTIRALRNGKQIDLNVKKLGENDHD